MSSLDERLWWTTVRPACEGCGSLNLRGSRSPLCKDCRPVPVPRPAAPRRPGPRPRILAEVGIQPPTCEYSETIPARWGFWVYRLWGNDTCLYVGIAGKEGRPRNARARLKEHEHRSWWPQVTRQEVRAFASSEDAAAEESRQITALMPVWNKSGAGRGAFTRRAS